MQMDKYSVISVNGILKRINSYENYWMSNKCIIWPWKYLLRCKINNFIDLSSLALNFLGNIFQMSVAAALIIWRSTIAFYDLGNICYDAKSIILLIWALWHWISLVIFLQFPGSNALIIEYWLLQYMDLEIFAEIGNNYFHNWSISSAFCDLGKILRVSEDISQIFDGC